MWRLGSQVSMHRGPAQPRLPYAAKGTEVAGLGFGILMGTNTPPRCLFTSWQLGHTPELRDPEGASRKYGDTVASILSALKGAVL